MDTDLPSDQHDTYSTHFYFRKDPEYFFAWPVNDVIAPGYSDIITQPMDFSAMKKKIDDGEYNSIDEYKVRISHM